MLSNSIDREWCSIVHREQTKDISGEELQFVALVAGYTNTHVEQEYS